MSFQRERLDGQESKESCEDVAPQESQIGNEDETKEKDSSSCGP